jgi:hypothetical protein
MHFAQNVYQITAVKSFIVHSPDYLYCLTSEFHSTGSPLSFFKQNFLFLFLFLFFVTLFTFCERVLHSNIGILGSYSEPLRIGQ